MNYKKLLFYLLVVFASIPSYAAITIDNIKYSASVALSCGGFNSLANSATVGVSCVAIDNSTNLYDDAYVTVISSTGAGAVGSDKAVYVYVYGSEDGSNYEQEESSAPSGGGNYTINTITVFRGPVAIPVLTAGKLYAKTFSIASFFGGIMPKKWGIILINFTGQTLGAANNSASYTGITYTNQ